MKHTSIDLSRSPVAPIENIPEWANFQAVDKDGEVYWYECRPEEDKSVFVHAPGDEGRHSELVCHIDRPANWRETLIDLRPLREAAATKARLAEAAPEMLEALKAAVACGIVPVSSALDGGASKYSEQVQVADQIRAAIAKATGNQS